MNYRIFEVEEGEKEALAELRIAAMQPSLEAVGRYDPDRASSRFLDNFRRELTRKIEVNGGLAGFYVVKENTDHLYLEHMYIHPELQGNGLGSLILKGIIVEAQERGLPLRLGALRGSRSNQFYQSHGFVQTHEEEWDIYHECR
ncbi:GNAT family N-acetyltransferase [Saccharospirillum impatiens]|uniref:GNAT family N-acetyltransferase n=1 Tax=Saccharospirillum impatiens TaxID=169438 RepID=UPI00048FA732|nr:GNAT family N-acetyltransferase [Saccharospirillum impatiens]